MTGGNWYLFYLPEVKMFNYFRIHFQVNKCFDMSEGELTVWLLSCQADCHLEEDSELFFSKNVNYIYIQVTPPTKEIKWKEWMSVNDKILIIQQINPSIAPHHAWEIARRFQIDELSPNLLSTIELSHSLNFYCDFLVKWPDFLVK
jgi:hypothetical protein